MTVKSPGHLNRPEREESAAGASARTDLISPGTQNRNSVEFSFDIARELSAQIQKKKKQSFYRHDRSWKVQLTQIRAAGIKDTLVHNGR